MGMMMSQSLNFEQTLGAVLVLVRLLALSVSRTGHRRQTALDCYALGNLILPLFGVLPGEPYPIAGVEGVGAGGLLKPKRVP